MLKLRHKYQTIGTHIEFEENITGIMINAIDTGLYAFSFSLGNSRNYTRKRIDTDDLITTMGLNSRYPMTIFSIIPSMYNLCGHRNTLAWNGNVTQDKKTNHVLDEISYELGILAKLDGSSIIELGSYRDKSSGLNTVSRSLNRINFKTGHKLVLMNSIQSYSNVGITLEDLMSVFQNTDSFVKPHLYIGLNLAYLFVNGLYDFRQTSEIIRLFKDIDTIFPEYVLSVILLTDTNTTFSSKQFNDTKIGHGTIWTNQDTLTTLLTECEKRHITVLTNNEMDMEYVRDTSEQLFLNVD
jgi:endonuclease IV